MPITHFNTYRSYSKRGQIIVYQVHKDVTEAHEGLVRIAFIDLDRGISGEVSTFDFDADSAGLMAAYDAGKYDVARHNGDQSALMDYARKHGLV